MACFGFAQATRPPTTVSGDAGVDDALGRDRRRAGKVHGRALPCTGRVHGRLHLLLRDTTRVPGAEAVEIHGCGVIQ
jgi:hypothetical protein